ncbi:hypothetical protein [Reyranella sp.]|uniref:hypothetical protein n=1 Tax=Reyranella sp. TaxID=1929291 RepID=UPI003BA96911
MADLVSDAAVAAQELRAHEQTFHTFNRLVLFAVLHVIIVLGCLALAFVGHVPLLAAILGIGGTIALIAVFTVTG